MSAGLATEPEKRLAERALAEAEYDLESARRSVKTTLGELRTADGVAANAPLRVEPLPLAAPDSFGALQDKLDSLVDAALVDRPDLAGKVADLRAREAATSRAKADFFPEIRLRRTTKRRPSVIASTRDRPAAPSRAAKINSMPSSQWTGNCSTDSSGSRR
jgi:outer membrane protein